MGGNILFLFPMALLISILSMFLPREAPFRSQHPPPTTPWICIPRGGRPPASDLADFVKIHRWDGATYYQLKDTTRKSQAPGPAFLQAGDGSGKMTGRRPCGMGMEVGK